MLPYILLRIVNREIDRLEGYDGYVRDIDVSLKVHFNMNIDPLQKNPEFDAKAELTNMQLTGINDFLKAYGHFDVSKGVFSVYAEAASKNKSINE